MISLFALIAGEFVFDPQSGHSKENKIPICCFSAKYAVLMSKSKDWFRNIIICQSDL